MFVSLLTVLRLGRDAWQHVNWLDLINTKAVNCFEMFSAVHFLSNWIVLGWGSGGGVGGGREGRGGWGVGAANRS